MSIAALGLLVAGLALLVLGAEVMVKGASKLAEMMGISPLVIGLTVVAYGTSAPEMAVSLQSILAEQADISIGNVIGSNLFNTLLILGLSALITPLIVDQQLIRLDVPIMIGVSGLVLVFGMDGEISSVDGLVLFIGAIVYTLFLMRQGRSEPLPDGGDPTEIPLPEGLNIPPWVVHLGYILVGLGLLVLGSRWLVFGAVSIARAIGVSELIIGLTIIAAGTSLPELATSAVASLRGERDIAVGNVVGSNIFNLLAVLGVAAVASSDGIAISPGVLSFDLPFMVAVAIACLPIFFTGNIVSRSEGLLFVAYYIAYTAYIIFDSINHDALPMFSAVLGWFVMPITGLTLVLLTWRTIKRRRKK
jgi:cation:H+ antiporter